MGHHSDFSFRNIITKPLDIARDVVQTFLQPVDYIASGLVPGAIMGDRNVLPRDSLPGQVLQRVGVLDGVPGGVASVMDNRSVKPVLNMPGSTLKVPESSQEEQLQNFFSPTAPRDEGTMGLFEAFGDGGGGFLPPGINSEVEMINLGIGDGDMINLPAGDGRFSYYEYASDGVGKVSVTDLGNDQYDIMLTDNNGNYEKFVQTGLTGRNGITDFDSNMNAVSEMGGSLDTRVLGVDISSLLASGAADPSATIQKGNKIGGTVMDMQRIDNLSDANFVSNVGFSAMFNRPGAMEEFGNLVLDQIDRIEQANVSPGMESNSLIQQIREGKSVKEVLGTDILNTDPVVNELKDDANTTLPGVEPSFVNLNEATGIITQTNPDGSQTEIVSDENQLNPRGDDIGPSIEEFHEDQAFLFFGMAL